MKLHLQKRQKKCQNSQHVPTKFSLEWKLSARAGTDLVVFGVAKFRQVGAECAGFEVERRAEA